MIRKKGYATNNEEYTAGLLAIAAPFFSLEAKYPVGAVSFDFSTLQFSMESAERKYAKYLLQLAEKISLRM